MKNNNYKPSEMKTMEQRRQEMLHFVVGGKETPAEKQERLARIRKTMTKKEYMKYLAQARSTVGAGCHSVVFQDRTKYSKRTRQEGKVACKSWQP